MKLGRGLFVFAICLTFVGFALNAAAVPKAKITVGKANCIVVTDGVLLPIRGRRVELGQFRCTASVVVPKKMKDPSMSLSVHLLQKPELEGQKEERGRVERKFDLWPGLKADVEIELPIPEDLNGCMPFSLVVEGAGRSQKIQASPACGD